MVVTTNPTTGELLERFPYTEGADLNRRLDTAVATFKRHRLASFDERAELLRAIAVKLRDEKESLARTAVTEMGKPIVQARAEVEKCAFCCDYFADNGAAMLADQPVASSAQRSYVAFRPLGVVFAIMPWNFPYWQVARAAIPAIAAGNVIVLKHAPNTTRSALEFERIIASAGAPDGTLSTVVLTDQDADRLIADDRIAAVTLTGSERAGIAVGEAAGRALKKSVLELGGSDAFIVLADADLDLAVKTAVTARFQNNGQSCIAAKRFIIEAPIYDEFAERFAAAAKAMQVGNPLEGATELGPLARADLRQTLHEQVRDTIASGAHAVTGAKAIDGAGSFYAPTLVAEVQPGMRMFDEEVFGPAAALVRATGPADAVAIANRSSYGLGGSIWTRHIERGEELAKSLESGAVFINALVASDPRLPFGGIKKSGYGRELSAFGIHEFTNIQTVASLSSSRA